MEPNTLLKALQAILDASTGEKRLQVIEDHPELLSEEIFSQIEEMAIIHRNQGQTRVADTMLQLAQYLSDVREQKSTQSAQQSEEEWFVPLSTSSGVRWARLFRQYWGEDRREILDEAITAARRSSVPELAPYIVDILLAYQKGDSETVEKLAIYLHPLLIEKGHPEEAWTLALVDLSFGVLSAKIIDNEPEDQRSASMEFGLKCGKNGIRFSHALRDLPCHARFLLLVATHYSTLLSPDDLETAYRSTIEIYEQLSILQPDIYQKQQALALVGLGSTLYRFQRVEEALESYRAALKQIRLGESAVLEPNVSGLWW